MAVTKTWLLNGKVKVVDRTPSTVFPSKVFKFRSLPLEKQVFDSTLFGKEKTFSSQPPNEAEITRLIRRNQKTLSRVFPNMEKLRVGPMGSFEDGYAFMTPGTATEPSIWLSYTDERYQNFVIDLVNRLLKKCSKQDDIDSVLTLLVDYSVHPPYASCLRHDGSYKVKAGAWPRECIESFSRWLGSFLRRNFNDTETPDAAPPLNGSKSPGFFNIYPDGAPYVKSDHMYVAKSLYTEEPNNIMRYDNSGFKLEWASSGALKANLEWFYANAKRMTSPLTVLEAFERCSLSVHMQAYRTNCPDTPIISGDKVTRSALASAHTKDRQYGYEVYDPTGACRVESGVCDNAKWCAEFKKRNPTHLFVPNRKRIIYPGPNPSFSAAFIFLCRLLTKSVEDSAVGFPRAADASLRHFEAALAPSWRGRVIVTYDRSNAEQFITDNWDDFIQIVPDWLRTTFDALGVAVLPSTNGPRALLGALVSGAAPTTFFNMICGMFELTLCVRRITGAPYDDILSNFFECMMKGNPFFSVGGLFFSVTLTTDDTVFYVFSNEHEDSSLQNLVKDKLAGYFEERSLKGDVCSETTCFGLDFTLNSVQVSKTRGLGKLWLSEHRENGDQVALGYMARLSLLPEFYDDIAACVSDHGFGDVGRYEIGAKNFMSNLQKFGYPVDALYNVHSPVEQIIYGSYLQEHGYDVMKHQTKYPIEELNELREVFNKWLK